MAVNGRHESGDGRHESGDAHRGTGICAEVILLCVHASLMISCLPVPRDAVKHAVLATEAAAMLSCHAHENASMTRMAARLQLAWQRSHR